MDPGFKKELQQQRLGALVPLLEELGVQSAEDLADVEDEDLVNAGVADIQRRRFGRFKADLLASELPGSPSSLRLPEKKAASTGGSFSPAARRPEAPAAQSNAMQQKVASSNGGLQVQELQMLVAEVTSAVHALEQHGPTQGAADTWRDDLRKSLNKASDKLQEVRDKARGLQPGSLASTSPEVHSEIAALNAFISVFSSSLSQKLTSKLDHFHNEVLKNSVPKDVGQDTMRQQLERLEDQVHSLQTENRHLSSVVGSRNSKAVVHSHCDEFISNHTPVAHPAPSEATLVENTLLFLPQAAVRAFDLEPNMDDKGDPKRELWFGRVWELRALLHEHKMHKKRRNKEVALSDEAREQLSKNLMRAMRNEKTRALLSKLGARWKGAATRKRDNLKVLEELRWCSLRGTCIYAHGSGGCSWDNFRICRMMAKVGVLVIAPDGFAYPDTTAMGKMRHKDITPLKKTTDSVDYWAGDLLYKSDASGSQTYSTKADAVLQEPEHWREFYENCYRMRRDELHFIMKRLPVWVKSQGFFIGGTSEGAMTVARFDDQRYGRQVIGRFINSFGIEYCYFTPTPEAGRLGGQRDVPTLNIIGTKDQFFGAEDSVAKIVAEDPKTGYGSHDLTGHGYKTMVKQGVDVGLVCLLEDGVHSPCNTHDNFLRELFHAFFTRPGSIWQLHELWQNDELLKDMVRLEKTTAKPDSLASMKVTLLFVPTSPYPIKMSQREMAKLYQDAMNGDRSCQIRMAAHFEEEKKHIEDERADIKKSLETVRQQSSGVGGRGFSEKQPVKMPTAYDRLPKGKPEATLKKRDSLRA